MTITPEAGAGPKNSPAVSLPPHLEGLETQRWSQSSPEERIRSLQRLEVHAALEQHRSIHLVEANPSLGSQFNGMFWPGKNGISLNPILVGQGSTPYRAMHTVLHEGRHGFQYDAVSSGRDMGVPQSIVESWRDNLQAYFPAPNNAYERYLFQPLEDDANRFATESMKAEASHFVHDPGYQQFLTANDVDAEKHKAIAARDFGADFREKIAADVSERASRLRSTRETGLEQGQEARTPLQPRIQQSSASAAGGRVNMSRALMSQPVPAAGAVGRPGEAQPTPGRRVRASARSSSHSSREE